MYARATGEASDLGDYEAVRNRPLTCRFALIKMKPAGRQRKYPSGKVTNNSSARKIAQRSCPLLGNREPWLLSYSPELSYPGANAIIKLYGQRIPKRGQVKIEQQFRDTKNLGLGMGLSQSKSAGQPRLQALLLIAHIAALTKRLIGEAAKAQQMALQLISNHNLKRDDISDDARYTCDRARRLARQNH